MTLESDIINIPPRYSRGEFGSMTDYLTYKEGHRDARHAAAEIALKGDRALNILQEIDDYYLDEIKSEYLRDKIADFLREVRGY